MEGNETRKEMKERYQKIVLIKACKSALSFLERDEIKTKKGVSELASTLRKAIEEAGESEEFLKNLDQEH